MNADKLITPEEKAQLETAKQNADTLKGEADSAVKALPDTAAEKGWACRVVWMHWMVSRYRK
ncbi:GA-like domain-containing protein [Escherichia coli]|uniref:GA-like domain-containing protein n=1 Tax=Escherichia coli TaxID=562 RepID=UPI003D80DCDA